MSKSLIQSQFSRSAEAYVVSPVHARGASLARMVELAAPESGWKVLDIATGGGHAALAFAPHVAHVTASDMTPRMLEVSAALARERGIENISFEEADAEALPFDDASFDLVSCRIAPHHFAAIDRFVAEVARVLKPGGVFVLVDNIAPDEVLTPGYSDAEIEAAARAYNAFEKLRDPGHVRALPLAEWLSRLEAAGLAILHHEVMLKPMAFGPWVDRLVEDAGTKTELRNMVDGFSAATRAFLSPETRDDGLWLTWTEGLVIARKA